MGPPARFSIDVRPVNDPPEMEFLATPELTEGVPFSLAIRASDPEGDPVALEASGMPPWMRFDGRFVGTPPVGAAQSSPFHLSVTAGDGRLTTRRELALVVGPGSQASIDAPERVTVVAGETVEFTIMVEGELTVESGPEGGFLTAVSDHEWKYVWSAPAAGVGVVSFVAIEGRSVARHATRIEVEASVVPVSRGCQLTSWTASTWGVRRR